MPGKPRLLGPLKNCSKCGKEKPLEDFYRKSSTGRPDSWCKSCKGEQNRLSIQRNLQAVRDRRRKHHLLHRQKHLLANRVNAIKRKYGIAQEDYDAMLLAQGASCPICGADLSSRRDAHIDHCHKTNRVRGILCPSCNKGLGMFRDNGGLLLRAYAYLVDPSNLETVCVAHHKERTEARRAIEAGGGAI